MIVKLIYYFHHFLQRHKVYALALENLFHYELLPSNLSYIKAKTVIPARKSITNPTIIQKPESSVTTSVFLGSFDGSYDETDNGFCPPLSYEELVCGSECIIVVATAAITIGVISIPPQSN